MSVPLSDKIDALSDKLDEKHEENITRLTRIETGHQHLDQCLDDLKKKLFGNGQPGIIQIMDNRLSNNEKWMWRAMGFMAALAFVLNFVFVIAHVLEKKP